MSLNTPSHRDRPRLSDAELIARFRTGDAEAYGRLWERHIGAGIAAARAATDRADPEDIAAEAFLAVMEALNRGKGPDFAFRPYLLAAVRNTASRWGRRQAKNISLGDTELEDERFSESVLSDALDSTLLARGFKTLPARWQEVLWYTEVENLSPRETAALMGMRATAISSLAYRAREGLRVAWIKAHIASEPEGSECRWTIDHLPARERGTLDAAERERIAAHLAECEYCPIALESAQDASRRLSPAALSALLGAGAGGAYLEWLRQPASASAATPTAGATTAAHGAFAGAKLVVAAAMLVTAGALVATGVALHPATATEHRDVAVTMSQPTPAAAQPAPGTPRRPSPAGTPAPAPVPTPSARTAAPTPTSPSTATTGPATPVPAPAPSEVAAPAIAAADTGDGRFYPIISGQGVPGAHVTLDADGTTYTAEVAADGTWASTALTGLSTGVTRVTVTQTASGVTSTAAQTNVDLASVSARPTGTAGDGSETVAVSGIVSATVTLATATSSVTVTLDSSGTGTAELAPGTRSVTAYYSDGARRGPATTVQLPPS